MLNAYAIRKMVPRLVIGVILINLSIYLCIIMIDLTDIVGKGLGDLLRAPFIDAETFQDTAIKGNITNTSASVAAMAVGTILAGILVGSAGSAALGILAMVAIILLPLVFVALAVVITLAVRYGLVIFLTVVSPIAIACMILPSTEKYFRQWWSLFLKTLLVFPIVAALFAMSDIMAAIFLNAAASDDTSGGEGLIAILIAVVAICAPIFMIPFSFKFAGGVLASAYDIANKGTGKVGGALLGDKNDPDSFLGGLRRKGRSNLNQAGLTSKGITSSLSPTRGYVRGADNSRKARQERMGARQANIRQAYRDKYAQEDAKSMFAQSGAQTDEVQMDMAFYGSSAASRQAIEDGSHVSLKGTRDSTMKSMQDNGLIGAGDWSSLSQADQQAVMQSSAVRERQDQLRMYSSTNDKAGRTQIARATAAKSQAALSYGYSNGEEGWKQAVAAAEDIYGPGNTSEVLNHLNELQYVAKQVGRSDLAGNTNSKEYNLDRATQAQSTYQLLNGKPSAVKALMDSHMARMQDPHATDAQKEKSAVFLHEMAAAQSKSQGTGDVRDAINERSAASNGLLKDYYESEAAMRLGWGTEPPPDIVTAYERTSPDPANPGTPAAPGTPAVPGDTITRRETSERAPANTAEAEREMARRVQREIEGKSRAYTPVDPNNLEDK